MNNGQHPQDLDEEVRLPRFLEDGIGKLVATERPARSVATEDAAAAHAEKMLADLAKLIKLPSGVPPIGVDAALKVSKCFEIAAADVRAIAADRVKAAQELEQEAETYATVLEQAGKVLATRVSAEAARAYKLSNLLREARDIIAGTAPDETDQASS